MLNEKHRQEREKRREAEVELHNVEGELTRAKAEVPSPPCPSAPCTCDPVPAVPVNSCPSEGRCVAPRRPWRGISLSRPRLACDGKALFKLYAVRAHWWALVQVPPMKHFFASSAMDLRFA